MVFEHSKPRVTVFIPAYNAEQYVEQAIESVMGQTFTDFELLVIDDGSTDNTPLILNRYRDNSRVRIVIQKQNQGRPRTRNTGLEIARGDYIALMDADDVCAPERLARQVAYLDTHLDIDVLGCLWSKIDIDGQPLSGERLPRQVFSSDEIAAQMLFCCPVHQPTMLARANVLGAYRYDNDFPVAQDHELWSRMARSHRFAVLPEILMFYRHHREQATAGLDKIQEARMRIQSRQLALLGLRFNAQDVWNHNHLFHFKGRGLFREQTGRELDMDFVRWSRRWIEQLAAANLAHQIYPQRAFSRILGARWLFVCRKAAAGSAGLAVWREFFASSLKSTVARSVLHNAYTMAAGDHPR